MKALILSDIHSNSVALEAIWQQEQDSDLVYCTGDLVDYGPFPKQVLDWVRQHGVICTQGNHDRWVAKCYRWGKTLQAMPPDEQAWAHHNASLLDDGDIRFLEELPPALSFELDGIPYGLTHFYKEYEEVVSLHAFWQFTKEQFPVMNNDPMSRIILGHTHRQSVRYLSNSNLVLNPGSVSYRRQDDPDLSTHYATITDGVISLKRLIYDQTPLREAVEQADLMQSEMKAARRFFNVT